MPALCVAVGSLRPPKLNAVRLALADCAQHLQAGSSSESEVAGFDVASGVRSTPLSGHETMQGARRRADALRELLRESNTPWHYFVGLEGGLETISIDSERRVFLQSWAYVADAAGRGHYGQSGAIALPDELATRVIDQGVDLSEAIDAFAGAHGIRDGLGAWGVLTSGLITREQAFRIATINAFAPFFSSRRACPTANTRVHI